MPNESQQAVVTNTDLATMRFEEALEVYASNFLAVLPPNMPLEHFKRMVVTAVNLNPKLRLADRRTFFNACVKCASDGLLPDGREAALTIFPTKIKDKIGNEHYIDAVQYLPMVAGIRKRMRNSGEVLSATAEVVYRNDTFYREFGDDPKIIHKPPPLGEDRGEPVGAYAIIRLANGEVLRDVMTVRDIERSRKQSKAPNSLMWTHFWDQGAEKTVLRRCSKEAPQTSVLSRLLARDEELLDLPPAEELPAIPPRPRRKDFVEESRGVVASTAEFDSADAGSSPAGAANEDVPLYGVVNCDGETTPCTVNTIEANMMAVFAEAQKRGQGAIETALENNEQTISDLAYLVAGQPGFSSSGADIGKRLMREIHLLRAYLARSTEDGLRKPVDGQDAEPSDEKASASDLGQQLAEHLKGQLTDIKLNKAVSDWQTYADKLMRAIPLVTDPAQFAKCRLSHDMNRLRTAGEEQKQRWQDINAAMAERERVLSKKARKTIE